MVFKAHAISDECIYDSKKIISFSEGCTPKPDNATITTFKTVKYAKNVIWFLIHYIINKHVSTKMGGKARFVFRGGTAFMIKWMEHKQLCSLLEDTLSADTLMVLPNDFDYIVLLQEGNPKIVDEFEDALLDTVREFNCAFNNLAQHQKMAETLKKMSVSAIYKYAINIAHSYANFGFNQTVEKLLFIDEFLMPNRTYKHGWDAYDKITITVDALKQQWVKTRNHMQPKCALKQTPFHLRARVNIQNAYHVVDGTIKPISVFNHYQIIEKMHDTTDNDMPTYVSHVDYVMDPSKVTQPPKQLSSHFYIFTVDDLLRDYEFFILQDYVFGASKKTLKILQRWCIVKWIAIGDAENKYQVSINKEYIDNYIQSVLSSRLVGFLIYTSMMFRQDYRVHKWLQTMQFVKRYQSDLQTEEIQYHMQTNKSIMEYTLKQVSYDTIVASIDECWNYISKLMLHIESMTVDMVVNAQELQRHWVMRFLYKDMN